VWVWNRYGTAYRAMYTLYEVLWREDLGQWLQATTYEVVLQLEYRMNSIILRLCMHITYFIIFLVSTAFNVAVLKDPRAKIWFGSTADRQA
jgi:hypothetical protein